MGENDILRRNSDAWAALQKDQALMRGLGAISHAWGTAQKNAEILRAAGLWQYPVVTPHSLGMYRQPILNELERATVQLAQGQNNANPAALLLPILDGIMALIRDVKNKLEIRSAGKFAELIIGFIISLLFFLAEHEHIENVSNSIRSEVQTNARQSEERLRSDLHEIDEKLANVLSTLTEIQLETRDTKFLRVKRAVPLCATKHYCRDRVALLLPGVEVEVIERSKKWVSVSVIGDDGEIISGWALKKYFFREAPRRPGPYIRE